MRGSRAWRVGGVVVAAVAVAAFFGCSAILGIGDYSVGSTDGGGDAPTVQQSDAADAGEGGCNGDPAKGCVSCPPQTNEDFLNSCPDNNCIPFDSTRVMPLLLPDGALPPLDGG
jgi:hypothetical protein